MCLWLSSSWGSPGLWRPDFPSPWTCLLGSREPCPPLLLLLTPWAPTLPPAYFPQSSAPCRPHWDSQGKLAHIWCRTEYTPVLQPVSRTPGSKGRMAVFFWWAGEPSLESCRLPPPSLPCGPPSTSRPCCPHHRVMGFSLPSFFPRPHLLSLLPSHSSCPISCLSPQEVGRGSWPSLFLWLHQPSH